MRSSRISDSAHGWCNIRTQSTAPRFARFTPLPAFKPNSVSHHKLFGQSDAHKKAYSGKSLWDFRFCRWECDLGSSPNFVTVMSSCLYSGATVTPPVLILIPPAPVNNFSASVLQLVLLPSGAEIAARYSCPKASG